MFFWVVASDIEQLLQDAPSTTLPRSLLDSNFLTVVELVVEAGAVPSRSKLGFNCNSLLMFIFFVGFELLDQARRLIQSGGLYINNQRVESVNDVILQVNHVIDGCITVVRTGMTDVMGHIQFCTLVITGLSDQFQTT